MTIKRYALFFYSFGRTHHMTDQLLFWLLALLATYSYFGYPSVLYLLSYRRHKAVFSTATSDMPAMTLIVTVHNEAHRIHEKLDDCLKLDYSGELEIIVASDHSTDDTDEIVASYEPHGVRLVRADKRFGKEYAQWCAIQEAHGTILVFSDVATQIPATALQALTKYFSDPQIGAVSSEDRFVSRDGTVAGEGAYVRYEMWLRKMESNTRGLVGLSGSFFAARKALCMDWDIESPSDFNTALNCATANVKAVSASDVIGMYQDISNSDKEYHRKVRTVLRGMTALMRHPEVLNPFRYGLFAFQVWSHKVMRWLVPWFLLALFAVSFVVQGSSWIYTLALFGQIVFYGIAIAAYWLPTLKKNALMKTIFFFVQVNIALAHSLVLLLSGKRMTVWQPSIR
jgi:glycosyltransferase involved in cell wall biosynthesis